MTIHSDCVRLCPTVSLKQWDDGVKRLYDRVPPYYYVVRARIQSIRHPSVRAVVEDGDRVGHSHHVFEALEWAARR